MGQLKRWLPAVPGIAAPCTLTAAVTPAIAAAESLIGLGPIAPVGRNCGVIAITPRSDSGASGIRSVGRNCTTQKARIRWIGT